MLTIDEARGEVRIERPDGSCGTYAMDTPEAFEAVSAAWLRCGWDVKYAYCFTWLGRPVIQLPEDLLRLQEVFWRVQPDVVIETGIAHGGSLIFYAGLFAALGRGRVLGVDVAIRPHNRCAIEAHPLAPRITLIEGSSTDSATLAAVRAQIAPAERVLVVLDSNHTRAHVRAELDAYAPLVTPGSYVVVCDGIMARLAGAPRSAADWTWNNPLGAVEDFLAANPDFVAEEPDFPFNEGRVRARVTYSPRGFLRRVGGAA
ncbi:MAG: cephalosporin hydroxylase family protein [Alphaproteobacteria bacterium]|nr:cephalosporin hydroxylase family protein [Alphaproteobacteria bacterium]